MAHHTENTERLELENGQLVRIVTATYKDFYLDVLKEYEDGTFYARNLEWSYMAGWLVSFPGEKVRHRYTTGSYIQKLEDWFELRCECSMWSGNRIPFNKDLLIEERPDLKYFFKKYKNDCCYKTMLALIRMYKIHPNIEALIEKGLYNLALNKTFQRLSKPLLTKTINFIKNTDSLNQHTKLNDILLCVKNNIEFNRLSLFKSVGKDKEVFNYLKNKTLDAFYYNDYISMCKKVGHDTEDPYWKFPNDLFKAHNKVMEEVKNVQKLNSKLKYDMLNEVLKDFYQYNAKINGFDVFVTADIDIIQKQCDVLYQCLIRNDYIHKEIMQENILVFFWKDGNPVATAEVFYNGKIGQFYGDERDRSKCEATPELKAALNVWLSKAVIKKRHLSKKIKYYKGFYDKKGNTFIGHKDFKFEIGKTYETDFDDDTITTIGADGCNATNKVFHFCDSIEEISKHYAPKYYCQVEPLGPILDCNGALLSNKIKIIKEITFQEVGIA